LAGIAAFRVVVEFAFGQRRPPRSFRAFALPRQPFGCLAALRRQTPQLAALAHASPGQPVFELQHSLPTLFVVPTYFWWYYSTNA